ncbi:MAG TPA: peptidoglycan synthetase [Phaeodactylibacter sp.]|nr:peptidoglycan synthetase [Phaeodactylibacter sp.]
MHNLAIALKYNHHTVTGSDDEIYNPSKERLKKHGLLPLEMGWFPHKITENIDIIILGMHARKNNPELKKAKKLGLKIYSYPEFIYEHSKNKQRIIIAGSHGKTTTTSIILHVLKSNKMDFDYLVGAQIEGFDSMVRLSNAPLMVVEGDEYLSSPIDRRPKILHYHPHISILTGIAWDHINVFPTFENYKEQFLKYLKTFEKNSTLFFYQNDPHILDILKKIKKPSFEAVGYEALPSEVSNGKTYVFNEKNKTFPIQVFGKHNLENLNAAYLVCKKIGLSDDQFFKAIKNFKGAAKRLQLLRKTKTCLAFLDFAHAPSKVEATIKALQAQYPKRKLIACLELHTFSSLNKKFLTQYAQTMNAADKAIVYFSEHTLEMKKLPPIAKEEVKAAFDHKNIQVVTNNSQIISSLKRFKWENKNLLMMTSGTFGGMDLKKVVKGLF